jgi:hypothetical protein
VEGLAVSSESQVETSGALQVRPEKSGSIPDRGRYAIYGVALAVSISIWFLAIRAPLWLDETVSFFVIKGGFREILSRQGWPGVPAYPFLLWLWVKTTGSGEITLRVFSVLAMLGATYLLYRAARELFDWDIAIIATVVFCLHPVVIFAAIDIRPYPFAALAITSSTFALVRLRHSNSSWLAALFGVSSACIVYFQFLFVVILPALGLCFFLLKDDDHKRQWKRIGVALAVFTLAILPMVPGVRYLFHTSGSHVFDDAPTWDLLTQTLAQAPILYAFVATVLVAAATRQLDLRSRVEGWPVVLCATLAFVPLLILYGVSVKTSIHIFVFRYRLVAIPGIALCWAFLVSRVSSRWLRLLFCVSIVAATAYQAFRSPTSRIHDYTWKYALEFVDKNASADDAAVLICSDLPESDSMRMPPDAAAKDSVLFAPLSYYPVSARVVPLPRGLNNEAKRAASAFLKEAAQRHERFLAVAFMASWETLDWLEDNADATHSDRELGEFNGIKVLEFIPRTPESAAH